jgi:hypothetical protein
MFWFKQMALVTIGMALNSCVTTSLENKGMIDLPSSNVVIKFKINFETDIETGCVVTYERDQSEERFELVFKGPDPYFATFLQPGYYRARNIRCMGSGRTAPHANFPWLDLKINAEGLNYYSVLTFQSKFDKGQHYFVTGFENETTEELKTFFKNLRITDQNRLLSPVSGKKINRSILDQMGDQLFIYNYPSKLSKPEFEKLEKCVNEEIKRNRFIVGKLEVVCESQLKCEKYKVNIAQHTGTQEFDSCIK